MQILINQILDHMRLSYKWLMAKVISHFFNKTQLLNAHIKLLKQDNERLADRNANYLEEIKRLNRFD